MNLACLPGKEQGKNMDIYPPVSRKFLQMILYCGSETKRPMVHVMRSSALGNAVDMFSNFARVTQPP